MDHAIERITWIDATYTESQRDTADEYPEPSTITSVGFVVFEAATYVVLARELSTGSGARSMIAIPFVSITRREALRPEPLQDDAQEPRSSRLPR